MRRGYWPSARPSRPLDINRLVWAHEQEKLLYDPATGATGYLNLIVQEGAPVGPTAEHLERIRRHLHLSVGVGRRIQAWAVVLWQQGNANIGWGLSSHPIFARCPRALTGRYHRRPRHQTASRSSDFRGRPRRAG
jgi:hypothetical protein